MSINTAFGFETRSCNSAAIWATYHRNDVKFRRLSRLEDDTSEEVKNIFLRQAGQNVEHVKSHFDNHLFYTNAGRIISYIPILSFIPGLLRAGESSLSRHPDRWAYYARSMISAMGLGILFLIPDVVILVKRCLEEPQDSRFLRTKERFENLANLKESEKNVLKADIKLIYEKTLEIGDSKKAAELLYMYGRLVYGGDMGQSSNFTMAAIKAEITGTFPAKLADIQYHDFKEIDSLLEQAKKSSSMNLAVYLRWYGHACQNTPDRIKNENADRFEAIYGTAIDILKRVNSKDSNWEIGQILYNTTRFLYSFKKPGDVEGALGTLRKLIPYLDNEGKSLRAQELRAQIENITAIETSRIKPQTMELLKVQYACYTRAYEIASETAGFNPFLRNLFLNNKARIALELVLKNATVVNIMEIACWFDEVVRYVKEENYNHYYHATFLFNASLLEKVRRNSNKQKELLTAAIEVCDKFPNTPGTSELKAKIQASLLVL